MTHKKGEYPNGNRSGPDTDTTPNDLSVEQIIAAILDQKNTLSPEDLEHFDALLDAPDVTEEQRRELLQTLWNIVVAVIDFKWQVQGTHLTDTPCGKVSQSQTERPNTDKNMVEWKDRKLTDTHNNTVNKKASGGSP